MTDSLVGAASTLGIVAAKATLMYLTAIIGLRLGERRTLAQWTVIDVCAAVAVGTIIGRTAVASTQSYLVGAIALLTLIAAHRVASLARFFSPLRRLLDHRVRVLLAHGELRRRELRLCGLTDADLSAELRQRGIYDLVDVRYVLYEAKGGLTVVRSDQQPPSQPSSPLLVGGLDSAAGYRRDG